MADRLPGNFPDQPSGADNSESHPAAHDQDHLADGDRRPQAAPHIPNDNDWVTDDEIDDQLHSDRLTHWCHQCQAGISPIMDSGTPTCPACGSEFVEEVEINSDLNAFYDPMDDADEGDLAANVGTLQNLLQHLLGPNAIVNVDAPLAPIDFDRLNRNFEDHHAQPAGGIVMGNPIVLGFPGAGGTATTTSIVSDGTRTVRTTRTVAADGSAVTEQLEEIVPEDDPDHHQRVRLNFNMHAGQVNPEMEHIMATIQALFGPGIEDNPLMRVFNMVGDPRDYVFGQNGLDDIITQLMEQTATRNAPPPASADDISHLKKFPVHRDSLGEQTECSICQEELEENIEAVELPCKHHYHPYCIEAWLKVNGTCPVCRQPITNAAEVTPTGQEDAEPSASSS
ncbi:uncharacterized protein BJ171DRAFT_220922 [Polychytrium aggregatum]|uniref:uncharacterized protein n=1 Tax=Polychytrium aggregatum TaxID=110093 RepID=UPI0022FDCB5E|nr:uncharacterized protein BJ171DRAFT_220922 [Polychytrium aggregatum]KAI9197453.1 hypothetical protein BJ171DRAFT_220922 [Polychytrium aggregatum]